MCLSLNSQPQEFQQLVSLLEMLMDGDQAECHHQPCLVWVKGWTFWLWLLTGKFLLNSKMFVANGVIQVKIIANCLSGKW